MSEQEKRAALAVRARRSYEEDTDQPCGPWNDADPPAWQRAYIRGYASATPQLLAERAALSAPQEEGEGTDADRLRVERGAAQARLAELLRAIDTHRVTLDEAAGGGLRSRVLSRDDVDNELYNAARRIQHESPATVTQQSEGEGKPVELDGRPVWITLPDGAKAAVRGYIVQREAVADLELVQRKGADISRDDLLAALGEGKSSGVEAAAEAIYEAAGDLKESTWSSLSPDSKRWWCKRAAAGLEAARNVSGAGDSGLRFLIARCGECRNTALGRYGDFVHQADCTCPDLDWLVVVPEPTPTQQSVPEHSGEGHWEIKVADEKLSTYVALTREKAIAHTTDRLLEFFKAEGEPCTPEEAADEAAEIVDAAHASPNASQEQDGVCVTYISTQQAVSGQSSEHSGEGEQRVVFEFHPECLEGENVREFHPEIVGAATGALRTMLDPETDARAHRDADILASCAVSEALKALVAVASLDGGNDA